MTRRLMLAVLAAAIFAPVANAEWRADPLDRVASYFAARPVEVLCRNEEEDSVFIYAWGYVENPVSLATNTKLHEKACLGALAIDLDVPEVADWQKALGVETLLHEAFHLRRVRNNQSEKITECRAFRNYDRGLRRLGAEPGVIDRLMPLAIAHHFWFMHESPTYDYRRCDVPDRYSRWLGER